MIGRLLSACALPWSAVAALTVTCSPAFAYAQERAYQFNIPSQDLGDALRAYGVAARQQLLFSEDMVRGRQSPPLVGEYPATVALSILLGGSGLQPRHAPSGSIHIVLAPQRAAYAPADAPASMASSSAPRAQTEAGAIGLEEVIVTAQRRETRLQDTPLAISAVTSADLERRQARTLQDIASGLPSLDIATPTTTGSLIAVRGVGSIDSNVGTESRVASHLDGVYMSRQWHALSQLMDMERIEYLRGPQGTLYGRNATGGALNFITRDPSSEPGGYLTFGAGNYSAFRAEGAVNIPFNERWSARVAGLYETSDGYDRDIISGRDVNDLNATAVRGKLKYDSETFRLVLGADYGRRDDHSGAVVFAGNGNPNATLTGLRFGGVVAAPPDVAIGDHGFPSTQREYRGVSSNAQWLWGQTDLTVVLGYRESEADAVLDADLTSAPLLKINATEDAVQYSGEVRLHRGGEKYDFLLGAYAFQDEVVGGTHLIYPRVLLGGALSGPPGVYARGVISGGRIDTTAYALFSQMRWNFTPAFYAEIGARYSYERKEILEGTSIDFVRPFSAAEEIDFANSNTFTTVNRDAESWRAFDPRLTIGYQPSSNLHLYGTVASGFKSGGFNLGGLQKPFEPEKLTNYEVGLKYSSDDRDFILEFSAFYYNYKNMQVFKIVDLLLTVENAAASTLKGVEILGRWAMTPNLTVGGSADVLDARYDEFQSRDPARPTLGVLNLAGNRLPQAPRYRARLDVTYTRAVGDGELSVRAEGSWSDRVYLSQYERQIMSVPPVAKFNAFVNYEVSDWSFQLYGRNLTDKRHLAYANIGGAGNGFPILGAMNSPRTYGVAVTRKW